MKLVWQSKLVLLAVLPFAGADVVLANPLVGDESPAVAIWTLGLSLLLGLVDLEAAGGHAGSGVDRRGHHRQPHVFHRYRFPIGRGKRP